MTDDKVIEAAEDAFCLSLCPGNPMPRNATRRDAIRAALAAADKVQAEVMRKDMPPEEAFAQEAEELFDAAFNNMGWKPIHNSLMRCFAAGLAKGRTSTDGYVRGYTNGFSKAQTEGDADRAALVEVLREAREFIYERSPSQKALLAHIDAALALVRKGE